LPAIIIASEKEWGNLINYEAKLEASYGLSKHFEVEALPAPNVQTQRDLIASVFQSREVSRLEYKFSADRIDANAKNLSDAEAMDRLIYYIITRVEALSRDQGRNHLMSLADVIHKMKRILLQDEKSRQRKVVDRIFVEQVLSRVFSMPLTIDTLPEKDPLVILNSPEILMQLQTKGDYPGPFPLTRQVVDVILGQTRKSTTRPIPATIILYGESGTGKTGMFMALVKVLGLQLYDFNFPEGDERNNSAQAFIMPISKLTDAENPPPGLINVDEALRHYEHFLTRPFGYRGFTLLDDAHGANEKVRAKVFARVRSLLDEGVVKATSPFDDISEEFSARNMTMFMTFNPTDNQKKIDEFKSGSSWDKATPEEVAIASLAGDGVPADKSFFKRWTLIRNLSEFPIEAKGPGLIEQLANNGRDTISQGQLVLVSPNFIGQLVDAFKSVDARTFFSGASNGILTRVQAGSQTAMGALKIIVPVTTKEEAKEKDIKNNEVSGEQAIGTYVQKKSAVLPVSTSSEGRLRFLELIVDNFRLQVIEGLVRGLQRSQHFAGDSTRQLALLSWVEQAILDHLKSHQAIPLNALQIDAKKFDAGTDLEVTKLTDLIANLSPKEQYFPKIFDDGLNTNLIRSLTDHTFRPEGGKTRSQVNSEYSLKVRDSLSDFLKDLMRVEDMSRLPNASDWVKGLDGNSDPKARINLSQKLGDYLTNYMVAMQDRQLLESSQRQSLKPMGSYESMRMFLLVLDRAIAQLPWSQVVQFFVQNLEESMRDMVLGSRGELQKYIFDRNSLLRPATSEMTMQMLLTSEGRQALEAEKDVLVDKDKGFMSDCERMLIVKERR
jgi:hypothetical protein